MSLQDRRDEIRRYNRRTVMGSAILYIFVGAIIVAVIIGITLSLRHDNEFTKQCNADGGWVASHDPLICLKDDKVVRIDQ